MNCLAEFSARRRRKETNHILGGFAVQNILLSVRVTGLIRARVTLQSPNLQSPAKRVCKFRNYTKAALRFSRNAPRPSSALGCIRTAA